mmetsp:Transcript_11779/g.14659  ORF Transcript_11779/g.14659 Transcript_11779/m.14659 type:complete len:297 (-) Transcript_11779:184-1074(-)|eukprot:CAMPEP_0172502858 /NCGR_PEP_ID=MMETSP1066-20121228/163311_1 /TAXON_ID=671091 /ORGANISM="Coscinodiscus wailesii, Strain CCMP2513" /LENGTH=296 /DNA_ID=CAMNT_0013278275 /DNA_START=56 /DNA_END=946 /DNA_ORIENTATION=+
METTSPVNSCLNILRRTPPGDVEENVAGLFALLSSNEDASSELLQRVDVPLKDAVDPQADERPYLLCDHNRDGDSYRSPWSNRYYPPLEEGLYPSSHVRAVEALANEVFHVYSELYYGKTAISSVYFWDVDDSSSLFAGTFLIRKIIDEGNEYVTGGYWNSIHVVEVGEVTSGKALYKLTTSLLVKMIPSCSHSSKNDNGVTGMIKLEGSITRQMEKICPASKGNDYAQVHVANIGKMIEDMEIEMRSSMDSLYIQKTKEVVASTRKGDDRKGVVTQGQMHTNMLNQAILARKQAK